MAYVIKSAKVKLDGNDVSSYVSSVAVDMAADDVDVTSMGKSAHEHLAGLRNDSFTLTAFSDFGTSGLHSIVNAKFVAAGTLEVIVWPNQVGLGTTNSTSNPGFTGYCPLLTYSPVTGGVGDAATTTLTLPVSGTITANTTPA